MKLYAGERGLQAVDTGLTHDIIACAIEVHRQLGPGLLESAYEESLCYEFSCSGLAHKRQVPLSVRYREKYLDCGYRIDIVVDSRLVVEIEAVERLLPVHDAQILTYLKLSGLHLGLLINFNTILLHKGIRRLVHGTPPAEVPKGPSDAPARHLSAAKRAGAQLLW